MSVFVNMEEGTYTSNSAMQTAEERDEVDLDYCLKRVLSSGYSIETAYGTPHRVTVPTGMSFGTPTPDRELRKRYYDSPPTRYPFDSHTSLGTPTSDREFRKRYHDSSPTLYPYDEHPSLECGPSRNRGRHSSHDLCRPGYDTTPDYLLPPNRRHSRVSFGPERQTGSSYSNPTMKVSGDTTYQTRGTLNPPGIQPSEKFTYDFPSRSFGDTSTSPPHRLPKLPQFSGEFKKEDVEFVVWKYEVNCLLKSGIYSEYCILESIRNSLKGKARSVLVHLGEWASVTEIMRRWMEPMVMLQHLRDLRSSSFLLVNRRVNLLLILV